MKTLLLSASAIPLLAACLTCQEVPPSRTLSDLQQAFEERRQAAMQGTGGSMQQFRAMMASQIEELDQFLVHEARGDDRFNGRLMLVDLHLGLAQMDEAKAALLEIDVEQSPPTILLVAADFANQLNLADERGKWIEAALAKDAAFEERMELARILMTRLVEVDLGQAIFDQALLGATNDEDRARVLWFQSLTTREREDLEEGAYHEALQELAEKHPETYYGSIARDRGKAGDLEVGGDPIGFPVNDLEGQPVNLPDYRGKVLLLTFWASWVPASRDLNRALVQLADKHQDQGFEILGISLDPDRQTLDRALLEDGCSWRQVFDGRVWQSEMALRYLVETVPYLLLIGRDGKIAAINLYPDTPEGIRELTELVSALVEKGQ